MYELIKRFEGFRKEAYQCSAGQWTIGFGNTTYKDGSPVQPGDTITEEEADELMRFYCEHNIQLPKGDFTENQKEALCSFIYNVGQSSFNRSTLKKMIEAKNWPEAKRQWMRWTRANGKVLLGLVKRREAECKLFFTNT